MCKNGSDYLLLGVRAALLMVGAAAGGLSFAQPVSATVDDFVQLDGESESGRHADKFSTGEDLDSILQGEMGASPGAESEVGVIPVAAIPKEEESAAAKPRPSSRMVEEIIVTAQKREEYLLDVPQAVTAFSGEKLEAMGVQSVQDLTKITPGLSISNAVGFNLVYLRGVGTDAMMAGADTSVPFYIDGIPLLMAQGSVDTLGRIERVEVLKGPQGTLFGTNSTGGAINIITPDPDGTFSGDFSAGLGSYNIRQLQGLVNVPITSNLAASISGFYMDQENFYTNDDPNGPPAFEVFARGLRVKALWDITGSISNTFYAAYQENSGNGGLNFENTRVWPAFSAILPQDPGADRHFSMNSPAGAKLYSSLIADTLSLKTKHIDVKLVGSWQQLRSNGFADFDASSTPLVSANTPQQLGRQYTGELQFSSNEGTPFSDRVTWVGGVFYIYSFNGLDPVQLNVLPGALEILAGDRLGGLLNRLLSPATQALLGYDLNDGIALASYGRLSGQTIAEYFQGTFRISDTVSVVLGQRYQYTERELENSKTSVLHNVGSSGELVLLRGDAPKLEAKQFSPRVSVQWFFDDNANVYASWARGYKSPTYNTVNLLQEAFNQIEPLRANRVDSYEIGLKAEWLERSLQFNTAAFYIDQVDLLTGFISLLTGGIFSYDNTPAAEIYGVEFDALWVPMRERNPGLVLTAAATYLDTQYTSYPNGRGYNTTTGLPFGEGFITPPFPPRDFSGKRIVRTPKLSYNVGVSQTVNIGHYSSLELSADVAYSSGFYFLPQSDEEFRQKPTLPRVE